MTLSHFKIFWDMSPYRPLDSTDVSEKHLLALAFVEEYANIRSENTKSSCIICFPYEKKCQLHVLIVWDPKTVRDTLLVRE
jgi:hypothetical protein